MSAVRVAVGGERAGVRHGSPSARIAVPLSDPELPLSATRRVALESVRAAGGRVLGLSDRRDRAWIEQLLEESLTHLQRPGQEAEARRAHPVVEFKSRSVVTEAAVPGATESGQKAQGRERTRLVGVDAAPSRRRPRMTRRRGPSQLRSEDHHRSRELTIELHAKRIRELAARAESAERSLAAARDPGVERSLAAAREALRQLRVQLEEQASSIDQQAVSLQADIRAPRGVRRWFRGWPTLGVGQPTGVRLTSAIESRPDELFHVRRCRRFQAGSAKQQTAAGRRPSRPTRRPGVGKRVSGFWFHDHGAIEPRSTTRNSPPGRNA